MDLAVASLQLRHRHTPESYSRKRG
jgi:hypothetical protein